MVASAVADRPRVDLRRNGIGDGSCAFEADLPDEAGADPDALTVVAVSPSTGLETPLALALPEARASEAAVAAPLARVLDQLDVLIAAQRRSQIIQREAAETLAGTAAQVEALSSAEDGIGAALELVRGAQDDLGRRVGDVEVFLMRLDRTLAGFDERIRELTVAADRPMRRAVALLMLLGATSTAAAALACLLLLRRAAL
jgi:hypothetical protein